MIEHRSPISGIDAHEGLVATAGYDNRIILWDARSKRALARANHDHLANACRFAPGGRTLVSASSDYSARIWSVPELELRALLRGHDDDVEMAAPSPDGKLVATASRDRTIGVFDAGGRMLRRLAGHDADVICVAWSGRARELVSSGDDGTVRRWCASSGRALDVVDLAGAETDTFVVLEPDRVLAGNDDGALVEIRGGEIAATTPAHAAGVKRLVLEPRRRLLLSAGYDGIVKLWSTAGGGLEELRAVRAPASVWLRACCFAGDDALAFGTFGTSYATFSIGAGRWDLDGVEDTRGINAVRLVDGRAYAVGDAGVVWRDGVALARMGSLCNFVGRAGELVVTGGQAGALFDARSGRVLHVHRSPLNCSASVLRGGVEHLLVGTYTGETLVFAQRAGELEHVATIAMHEQAIKGLACSDELIFSVCASGDAAFHRVEDLAPARVVRGAHRKIANAAAALPDGRFASVSRDLSLRIWTLAGAREHHSPHAHSIKCVAVAADGSLVATGSYDGWVGLFDPRAEHWLGSQRLTAAGISSIGPGAGASDFVASSYDGRLYRIDRDGAQVWTPSTKRSARADLLVAP